MLVIRGDEARRCAEGGERRRCEGDERNDGERQDKRNRTGPSGCDPPLRGAHVAPPSAEAAIGALAGAGWRSRSHVPTSAEASSRQAKTWTIGPTRSASVIIVSKRPAASD